MVNERNTGAMPNGHAAPKSRNGIQKGAGLTIAAIAVGLLTAFSGVIIELAAGLFSDLRHGVCVERLPGDNRLLWHAYLAMRPYNRMRCCGGALSVDHATQECRARSIISSTTPKRFAYPLRGVTSFGHSINVTSEHAATLWKYRQKSFTSLLAVDGEHAKHTEQGEQHVSGHTERSSHIDSVVGLDALSVRTHMSHLFNEDPTETWAEEFAPIARSFEAAEAPAVNEDVVQTQSESAGNLDPIFEWVPWDRALHAKGRTTALLISILGSALLALFAAMVTRHAIAAKGSGIPEVRASAAGFALPKHFHPHTLLGKIAGLSLCVGSGLAVGKEGPMIHIGACWGSMLADPISRMTGLSSMISDTELIAVGAASGVSAAFGAPLAGVLFAVEELGTQTPGGLRYSTMICAFTSAVVASLTLKWLDLTRTQRLTLFEVDYKQAWTHWEAVWFCILGMIGGVVGGVFIIANKAIAQRRNRGLASKECFCWFLPSRIDRILQHLLRLPAGSDSRVMEVVLLAIITCISNFPRTLTRIPQNDGIVALFSQCHVDPNDQMAGHTIHDPIGLCSTQNAPNFGILWLLFAAAVVRFIQTTITFGALVPAGLFVPSLFMGGCIGRLMGVLLKFAGLDVEPGIYGMVGAGAVLAGVSRLTISLVVVLFELTGGLTYVVPFMVAVLSAKWVGDIITDGESVYDVHAELSGLAKVEQFDDARLLNITMAELCSLKDDDDIADSSNAESGTVGKGGSEVPALWTSSGLVRVSDLAMHCDVAPKGFVVLSTDARGDIEVLGWADSVRIVSTLESAGNTHAERWCSLSPPNASAILRVQACMMAGAKPWSGVIEDFSDMIEKRGVTRIRHDCPISTSLCITQRCPSVKAFVSVDGPPYAARTMLREQFLSRLVSGRVRPLF